MLNGALAAQRQRKKWLRKKSIRGDYDTVSNTTKEGRPERKKRWGWEHTKNPTRNGRDHPTDSSIYSCEPNSSLSDDDSATDLPPAAEIRKATTEKERKKRHQQQGAMNVANRVTQRENGVPRRPEPETEGASHA